MKDLTGQRFGRLVAVSVAGQTKQRHVTWNCICSCGNRVVIDGGSLRGNRTRSCGCLQKETVKKTCSITGSATGAKNIKLAIAVNTKHGDAGTPLYAVWAGAKSRCYNRNNKDYDLYGGRGITMCDRWKNSYTNFRDDMGPRPAGTSLDRWPNNDGPYSPENTRWATVNQQRANQRRCPPK